MPVLTNIRHELFAQAVAKGADLVEAYSLAGFKRHEGNASRLRADNAVSARISEILKDAAFETGVTVEMVTREIAAIAFLDLREAADWGVREVPLKRPVGRVRTVHEPYVDLKPAKDLPPRVARAIASVKRTRYGVEIRPYSKLDALVRLGQQLGMFKDKTDDDKDGANALVAMIVRAHEKATGQHAKVIEGDSE